MEDQFKIWGVKALVFMKYDKDITSLAKKLASLMILPEFIIQTDIDPPYDIFGTCEVMGFEIWLKKSTSYEDFRFSIELETMLHLELGAEKKDRYDISPWLAQFISRICEIDSCIFEQDSQRTIFFPSV